MIEGDPSWSGEHPGAPATRDLRLAAVGRGTVETVFLKLETNSPARSIEVARPGSR